MIFSLETLKQTNTLNTPNQILQIPLSNLPATNAYCSFFKETTEKIGELLSGFEQGSPH